MTHAQGASPNGWALDRRISIAVLLAVAVQTAGALTWAGAAAQRVTQLEERVLELRDVGERLARLEEQMIGARRQLARIEAQTASSPRD